MGPIFEASRTGLSFSPARSIDQAGPLSFEGPARAFALAFVPSVPGYGREPVGNGHAAAGFSAGFALVVAAVGGGATGALSVVAAGLAACFAFFFLPAFFFFLADFFLPAAFFLATFFDFFFFDAFFFFFFFPPFFAFFFAIFNLLQGCWTTGSPALKARTIQLPERVFPRRRAESGCASRRGTEHPDRGGFRLPRSPSRYRDLRSPSRTLSRRAKAGKPLSRAGCRETRCLPGRPRSAATACNRPRPCRR